MRVSGMYFHRIHDQLEVHEHRVDAKKPLVLSRPGLCDRQPAEEAIGLGGGEVLEGGRRWRAVAPRLEEFRVASNPSDEDELQEDGSIGVAMSVVGLGVGCRLPHMAALPAGQEVLPADAVDVALLQQLAEVALK